jgi:predicted Zn finger-like uncharacterized protein
MITRCPRCETAFRVTENQLQARVGQVRCGRCHSVFDARAALVSSGNGAAVQPRASSPGSKAPATLSGTLPPHEIGKGADSALSFGRPMIRRSRWWWLASAIALVALAAQGTYRFRGDLATFLPDAKPLLQRFCIQLGCEIPLPRRADLLSIESSDLQADSTNPSVMVLTATLRNRAAFIQAFPALELSLTNPQDQTVARRVLNPQEYAPRGTRPDAGFSPGGELQVRVYMEAASLKASGYRLYLFYP